MGEIITGNELVSGATVYLTENGGWEENIDAARVFSPEQIEERDRLLEDIKAGNRILSLEIEKAERAGDKVVAERLRERIRSEGPTTPRQPRQTLGDANVSL
jgi:hypothetical protein